MSHRAELWAGDQLQVMPLPHGAIESMLANKKNLHHLNAGRGVALGQRSV